MRRSSIFGWVAAAVLSLATTPAIGQIRTVDPNDVIGAEAPPPAPPEEPAPAAEAPPYDEGEPDTGNAVPPTDPQSPPPGATQVNPTPTYRRDDLIGAAEGVFGRGAQGLAGMIERILKEQGEPNAYIAGREASGAFIVGLRYGSGTLSHKVEGDRPVYWTGPSVGFDFGGDAAKVFVLVYNLYDTQDLYRRYPQVEGRAYFVGGFSATYLRWGNVVLIPVRLGVGVRLGANLGYMRFSEKARWLPF